MTTDQIVLKTFRQMRDILSYAIAQMEAKEKSDANASLPSLFSVENPILQPAPKPAPVRMTWKNQEPSEEIGHSDEPREIRHRTPSDFRGRNAREGYISTTKISEQLTGKPHGANKEVIRICKEVGITLHKRSVNPNSCSHLYVNKAFIPTIVHQYHANHA